MQHKTSLLLALSVSLIAFHAAAQNEKSKTTDTSPMEPTVAVVDNSSEATESQARARPVARRIGVGQVSGRLGQDSPVSDDDAPYALYTYRGAAGSRIWIALNAENFDAFLAVGPRAAPGCDDECRTDDDGGEGSNSRLLYILPEDGTIEIRASALRASSGGDYDLIITRVAAPTTRQLPINRTVTAKLADTDGPDTDGRPHALWSIQGKPGQRLRVSMRSEQIDPLLRSGQIKGGEFVREDADDDSGPGNSAKLILTLDGEGRSLLAASSVSSGSSGSYQILANELQPLDLNKTGILRMGDSISSRLEATDWADDEGTYGDLYRIEGRPGQRIVVSMQSSDFATSLQWGIVIDGVFNPEMGSRDSEGDVNHSQITVTLDSDGIGRLRAASSEGGEGRYQLLVVNSPRISN